ncbi:hypothetical protein MRY87_06505 [bacterium]|nr:hypothetical protein [bacterium]
MLFFAVKLNELQVAALVDPILQRIGVSREDIVVECNDRKEQRFVLPLEDSSGDRDFSLRVSKGYKRAAAQRFSVSLMRGNEVVCEGYARTTEDFSAAIEDALRKVSENVSHPSDLEGAIMPGVEGAVGQ